MKIRTALATIALVLMPALALAQGCEHGKLSQSASECLPGQIWDTTQQTCVTPANS